MTSTDNDVPNDAATPSTRSRSPLLIAGVIAGAIAIFALGLLAGHGPRGGEFGPRGDRGPMGRHMQDGGRDGFAGPRGERGMGGGMMERGGPGGRHGGIGIVTSVSAKQLVITPVLEGSDELTFTLDGDTDVFTRGDAGARDLEDAKLSDIEEGAIVAVRPQRPDGDARSKDATRAAAEVVIVGTSA